MKYLKLTYLFLLIAFAFFQITAFALEEDSSRNDNEAYRSYYDKITVRPAFLFQTLELRIASRNDSDETEEITYKPVAKMNVGAGISWHEFGISASTDAFYIPGNDRDTYGSSDNLDFQMFYYFKRFNVDLFYQKYKGYYLDTESDNDIVKRPDLKASNLGLNVTYIFSKDFSFRSSYSQTEQQIISGGSFITMSSLSRFDIDADYSLIPPERENDFDDNSGYTGGNYITFAQLFGYSYNLIFLKNFHLNLSALVGPGYMHQNYETDRGKKTVNYICSKYNNRISFGYSNERYFIGSLAIIDIHSTDPFLGIKYQNTEDIIVTRMSVYAELFFGMRF